MSPRNRLAAVKAVVFDMDGTLCLPQPWMFPAMRQAVGLQDKTVDILAYIDALPTALERTEAHRRIQQVEALAMREMAPQPGLVQLMQHLTAHDISKNICTRNLRPPVDHLIASFLPEDCRQFDHVLTRDFRPTKPSADPLLHIARALGLEPTQLVMVGDSRDDMRSGRSAGCVTVLLADAHNEELLASHEERCCVDVVVHDLAELAALLPGRL